MRPIERERMCVVCKTKSKSERQTDRESADTDRH